MKINRIIFTISLLILILLQSGCSMMFVFYFRNFSNEQLIIRVVEKEISHNIPDKYLINRSIIKINRGTLSNMTENINSKKNGDETLIEIPPQATVCLKIQANNPIYLYDKFNLNNQPIAYLEKNNNIIKLCLEKNL